MLVVAGHVLRVAHCDALLMQDHITAMLLALCPALIHFLLKHSSCWCLEGCGDAQRQLGQLQTFERLYLEW